MAYGAALTVLADPTRRAVFEALRHGPASVTEIASQLPVSRPAVSQHLKALKEAGLVGDRAAGARRIYRIDPAGLGNLRRWLDQFWDEAVKIAPARKTIIVQASPDKAFTVFTAGLDRWWPKSHGIGSAALRESIIEPLVGGRWYTQHEDGTEAVVGHIREWQPPARFVCSWEINAAWKPDARTAYASEFEVRFSAEGPGSTRVEVEHRDFERMGAEDGARMRKDVDNGWPRLLELFVREAQK
jgi:DNA-binding transcriptional ArsR family regulator